MLIVNLNQNRSQKMEFLKESQLPPSSGDPQFEGGPSRRSQKPKVVKLRKESQGQKQDPVVAPNPSLPVVRRVKNLVHNFVQSDHAAPIGFSPGANVSNNAAKNLLEGCQKAVRDLSKIVEDRKDMSPQGVIHKVDALNFRNRIMDFLMKLTDGNPFGDTPPQATKGNLNLSIDFESKLDTFLLQVDARNAGLRIDFNG